MTVLSPEPEVKLMKFFSSPYDHAVASARTCYSPRVIEGEEVTKTQRERIGKMCLEGGHHTVFQHACFNFSLTNISRHFTWAFLHAHPFYNSSESSQRYVKLDKVKAFIPPIGGSARTIFEEGIAEAWEVYNKLSEILLNRIIELEDETDEKKKKLLEKKAIEIARYAIPIAALTSMSHSVNGLTLYRMYKLINQYPCSYETKKIVGMMVDEVKKADPNYFKDLKDPIPLEKTLEYKFIQSFGKGNGNPKEFDAELDGKQSKLVDFTQNGIKVMADAIRYVMGSNVSDEEAIDFVLNPAKNTYLSETLNLSTMSPLMRTMNHPYFVFKKKISHTGDCQNKRHRMTPASRPLILMWDTKEPDYITPELIKQTPEALEIYEAWMKRAWEIKNKLLEQNVALEYAQYILPNALAIRMIESTNLLNFWHKCKLRLCLNAQREIWKIARDELDEVKKVQPQLVKYFGPNCFLRKATEIIPYCPEGARWCGKTCWTTRDYLDDNRLL